jgi:hypothetical protein
MQQPAKKLCSKDEGELQLSYPLSSSSSSPSMLLSWVTPPETWEHAGDTASSAIHSSTPVACSCCPLCFTTQMCSLYLYPAAIDSVSCNDSGSQRWGTQQVRRICCSYSASTESLSEPQKVRSLVTEKPSRDDEPTCSTWSPELAKAWQGACLEHVC